MEQLSELRKFQLRMLEILKTVDMICRKNNIPYWLSCGTLLGAVRHRGFIPWDDDMDIEVRRSDYKKLINILKKELPDKYIIHNFSTDHAFFLPFTKIRDKYSSMTEGESIDLDYKYKGAFLDIFPMEYSSRKAAKFSDHAFFLSFKASCFLRRNNVKGRSFLILLFHYYLLIINSLTRVSSRGKKGEYYSCLGMNFCYKADEKDMFPLKEIEFEGCNFYAPHNITAYLENYFGPTYMELPEESERGYHGKDFKVW